MKKLGFTLAEILITLSIVGVVAAMTLPNLIANTDEAKIGPKLAKFRATFEQANMNLLSANSVDSLADMGYQSATAYVNDLQNHMKMSIATNSSSSSSGSGSSSGSNSGSSSSSGNTWGGSTTSSECTSNDSVNFTVASSSLASDDVASTTVPSRQYSGFLVTVNINGNNNRIAGENQFVFTLWNDGSLRPKGGKNWAGAKNGDLWTAKCQNGTTPTDATFCAGSVFENNLKVRYKLD